MIPPPEFYPAESSEVPGPDLFMTVIKVSDWPRVLAWYVETLGLLLVLSDDEHKFALLAAGNGRLAIQADPRLQERRAEERARLVFVVPDVDAERQRLQDRGIEVSSVHENTREGYREIRLSDPEGTPLTLFSWTVAGRGPRLNHPPE
jgi:catechol 2,3-dioxygenase-like lactoylglutathione lyase family enzyme